MSLSNAPAEVLDAYLACDPRQQKYIDGLLAGMFHDAAMREAGYAPSTARRKAGYVAKLPNVAKVLSWHAGLALAKQAVTMDRVVEEMGDIALFDPLSIYDVDGKVMPVNEWPESARRAFAGWDTQGQPKFVSKTDAAEKLAKFKGWYAPEKHEHDITDKLAESLKEARERAANR